MREHLVGLERAGMLDLPFPGGGTTARRFAGLLNFGRQQLALARLIEAHTDALAILEEAEHPAPAGLLGVWASAGTGNTVDATPDRDGWCLSGAKQYCSGLGIVDHALVTAKSGDADLLFLVPLDSPGLVPDPSVWRTQALAESATGHLVLDNVWLPAASLVGRPGFYLERPGFWHGAVGVAACWAGGALGIADAFARSARTDPHTLAHAGAVHAECWSLGILLERAASEIDQDPANCNGQARVRALTVRHLVERSCREVIDRAGRALGPGPLALDTAHSNRVADLTLYIRQHHAERDLEELGRLTRARTSCGRHPESAHTPVGHDAIL
jgi:alkylation response protein AidB-like acyl-CoA dehydrogenase